MSTQSTVLNDETRHLILDELFILPDENGKPRVRRPKVPDRVVRGIVAMIDSSSIIAKHEAYVAADRKPGARGGRPALIQPKHVLAARLILAEQGDKGTIAEMFMLLRHRLSNDARLMLDLPLAGSVEWRNDWEQMDPACVYRAFTRFSSYYDPKPMHRRQRELTDAQRAALDPTRACKRRFTEKERADLTALMDDDGIATRQRRADDLLNDIIGMSVALWPLHLRERWLGDIAIDETVLEACSQRRGHTNNGRNNRKPDQVLATEVWAGNHPKAPRPPLRPGARTTTSTASAFTSP